MLVNTRTLANNRNSLKDGGTRLSKDATSLNTPGTSSSRVIPDFASQLNKLNQSILSNPTAAQRRANSIASANNALASANADAASYQSQLDNLNSSAADSKRKNWVAYMKAIKALPQQMANNGINGGSEESSLVRLNAAYGSANNDVDVATLPDRTNLRTQLDAARATAAAAQRNASSAGKDKYVTNAYGNILNNSQQTQLNSIIRQMAEYGLSDKIIQQYLQKAGF